MSTADRELTTQREFPYPPAQVFAALTTPARLARWWGPAGFTNHFTTCDLRPGGRWEFVMQGPDGRQYPNSSVFTEVVPPTRFVIDHICAPRFQLLITLTEHAGHTTLAWRQVFTDAAVCAAVRAICLPANEQNLDRLAAELARPGA